MFVHWAGSHSDWSGVSEFVRESMACIVFPITLLRFILFCL